MVPNVFFVSCATLRGEVPACPPTPIWRASGRAVDVFEVGFELLHARLGQLVISHFQGGSVGEAKLVDQYGGAE